MAIPTNMTLPVTLGTSTTQLTSQLTTPMTNQSVTTQMTTAKQTIILTDGPYFDKANEEFMSINVWPLIMTMTFAIIGSIGNSIVVYIYWLKWKKGKTRVFILCLGLLDLTNCVFNMPVEIAVLWRPLEFDLHYLCKISRGCTYVINNTGSMVFVSIAIERLLSVYYPLRSRQLTPKFAKVMCLVSFLIASSVSWPSFIFYGSHTITIPLKENVFLKGKTCLIADEHEFRTGLILIFTTVLFVLLVLVFIVLTALYVAIGRKIYIVTCASDIGQERDKTTKLLSKSIISAFTGVAKAIDNDKKNDNNLSKSKSERLSIISDKFRSSTLKSRSDSIKVESETVIPISTSVETKSENPNSKTETDTNNSVSDSETSSINNNQTQIVVETIQNGNDTTFVTRPINRSNISPRNSRRFSSVNSQATRNNTLMMRMVTIAFMLSFTPFLCILIIRYTNPKYYFGLDKAQQIVYQVFIRTYFINSMVNPVIYGFMNRRFRRLVKEMFRSLFCSTCCCGGKKEEATSRYYRSNASIVTFNGVTDTI